MRKKINFKFFLSLLVTFLLVVNNVIAQDKAVTGIITDSSGKPLSAASVKIKGTSRGTITDNQGAFSIQASAGTTLEISALNYATKEVVIGDQNYYNIVLSSVNNAELSDVVVTAYGTQRKINVTGSIVTVS